MASKYIKPQLISLPKYNFRASLIPLSLKPHNPTPWRQLPHITQERLPDKPTDIRGIDSAGFTYMERRRFYRNLPTVSSNKFFTLKFVPEKHHLCIIRKSNVAFTFTNSGSAMLNDSTLQQKFHAYKGKYSKADFFKTVPSPSGTAASRDKNRKLIKRTLHRMLHQVAAKEPVSKVSGIFYFKFHDYAVTQEQKSLLESYLRAAVKRVCQDKKFLGAVMKTVDAQNKGVSRANLLKGVRIENTLGASSVPGYYPKLPYLNREEH